VWLDPDNAIAIVELVARALIEQDPASAVRYADNARRMIERIHALDRDIARLLSTVRDVPYVVFHDAYQGFENHYGLHPVAAITAASAKMPGTRRVLAIRRHLRDAGVRCVFGETRYPNRLLDALIEGLDVRRGVLDPLGREAAPSANGWLHLMWQLAKNLHMCLSAP
jgi:zinc transport system substrate-binding protein